MPQVSSSDLARLEYEFATNPGSEAFIDLARAYLDAGRYVEAMVVCKKGIKAHPQHASGRYIMACIYRAQGKHQKAIDELNNLLKIHPDFADAYCLLGEINEKLGKEEQAVQFFKKALDYDAGHETARKALLKRGIDYARPEAAQQAEGQPGQAEGSATAQQSSNDLAVQHEQIPTQPQIPAGENVPEGGLDSIPTERAMPAVTGNSQASPAPRAQSNRAAVSQEPRRMPPRPAPARRTRIQDIVQQLEEQEKKKQKSKGAKFTIYMAIVLGVALVIYVIYTWQAGLTQKKINEHLKTGRTYFSKDTYAGYLKALEHYKEIIKLDDSHLEALARAAFICAVLPGEFKYDGKLFGEGQKYLQKALATGESNTLLVAARALLAMYGSSNLNEARNILEKGLKNNPNSGVLNTTMGIVLLRKGELSQAKEYLIKGAGQPESATRALIALGEYAWRRSMYREAGQAFGRAQQANPEHSRAVLYAALNALLWGRGASKNKLAASLVKKFHEKLESQASPMEKDYAALIEAVLATRNKKTRKSGLAKLKAILDSKKSDPMIQFVGARTLRQLGRLEEAKKTIELALRLESSRPDFALEEAAVYLDMKKYEDARSRAMRVQEMDAESGLSAILIGDAYMGEKNYNKALEYYKNATKYEDTEALAHLRLGNLYLTKAPPDIDKAQAQFELAVPSLLTMGERHLAAVTAVKLAKIYLQKNRHEEFRNILMKAMQADESLPEPYCLIAQNLNIDVAEGRQQAAEMCKKCIQYDESSKLSAWCRETFGKERKPRRRRRR